MFSTVFPVNSFINDFGSFLEKNHDRANFCHLVRDFSPNRYSTKMEECKMIL